MDQKDIIAKLLNGVSYNECTKLSDSGEVSLEKTFDGRIIGEVYATTRPTNYRIHRRDRHIFSVTDRPKPLKFRYLYNPEVLDGKMLLQCVEVV